MKKLTAILMTALIASVMPFVYASDPEAPAITANKFTTPPAIDGDMDNMWEPLAWHSLNYVWMEWDTDYDSTDYYGRFKVGWSEDTDLLYFFVEVTDDMIVQKYGDLGGATFANDIVEIFIDEDNNGGEHIFDAGSTNGEDAFSYHLCPLQAPEEGTPETDFFVSDIAGTGWGSQISVNYFNHFDDAIIVRDGDKYFWEFALKVYTKDYDPATDEGTTAELELDKQMGLALAYCESDKSSGNGREMVFGSYEGHADKLSSADGGALYGYNEAWKDATDYNVLTLAGEAAVGTDFRRQTDHGIDCYTNRNAGTIVFRLESDFRGKVGVEVIDLLGRRVLTTEAFKQGEVFNTTIPADGINEGVYVIRLTAGRDRYIEKVVY